MAGTADVYLCCSVMVNIVKFPVFYMLFMRARAYNIASVIVGCFHSYLPSRIDVEKL